MKKRILLIITILAMSLVLISCSNDDIDSIDDLDKIDEKELNIKTEESSSENKSEKGNENKTDEVKSGYRKGNKIIDFELKDLDGKAVKLSELEGSPVVLNFFASWCHFCKVEMPAINKAHEKYKDDGVKVIGINLAFQDNAKDVEKMLKDMDIKFTIVKDETGVPTSKYGITGIPVTIFIDKKGIVSTNHVGVLDEELLEKYIAEIL